jgi:uncharacterized glyoxalase superfamily protein PhnB
MPDESTVQPTLAYRDPMAAAKWLQQVFGAEVFTLLTDEQGRVGHCVMSFGAAQVGVMGEWSPGGPDSPAQMKSPLSLGGAGTQFLWLTVADVRAHCEHARRAGARILQEPADQFYGDRTYRALDCDGHVWNFRQKVEELPADAFSKMGLTERAGELKA